MEDDAVTDDQPWDEPVQDEVLRAFLSRHAQLADARGASQGVHLGRTITVAVLRHSIELGAELEGESESELEGELVISIGSAGVEGRLDPATVALGRQIMAQFSGLAPTAWQIAPRRDELCVHAKVSTDSVAALLTFGAGHEKSSSDAESERPSHIVRESELVHSLVDGHVVRSMCGHTFVPTETGEKARSRSVCARCALVVALARRVIEQPR